MIPDIKKENDLRKLAGLPIKEAEHSLDSILNKYPEEFKSVMMGQSMLYDHDKFFDELYDWFVNSGEMPYGIAKAREGDPDQFIQDYLEQEYGHEFDDDQAMDAQKAQMPASLGGSLKDRSADIGSTQVTSQKSQYHTKESKEPKTFKEHLQAVQEDSEVSWLNRPGKRQAMARRLKQRLSKTKTKSQPILSRGFGGGGGKMPSSGIETTKDPTGMSLLRNRQV